MRRGVVVDQGRGFGPGQFGEQAADAGIALAAPAGFEVEGERAVALRDFVERLPRGLGEDGPAEAGMHEDAGRVDRFPHAVGEFLLKAGFNAGKNIFPAQRFRLFRRHFIAKDFGPDVIQRLTASPYDPFPAEAADEAFARNGIEQGIDGGKLPKPCFFHRPSRD